MTTQKDKDYLKLIVELTSVAIDKGDEPYGSLLVSESGEILFEGHNRVSDGDATQHPEFSIARWPANNISPEKRQKAIVYTTGEHCPMCSGAHGLFGLGRIVYASSAAQSAEWPKKMGLAPSPVKSIPIQEVIHDAQVEGPVE